MNKQELIEKYKSSLNKVHKVYGDYYKTEAYEEVLKDLKQLDEPQKPVVKQFVADWYEEHKEELEFNIWDWIKYTQEEEKIKNRQFTEWLAECENDPVETLIKMKLFGYEVEKEKRYYVKAKKIADGCNYLNCRTSINEWSFAGISEPIDYRTRHTHKQLEQAGFGWVFDCPGIEIEEVEG